MALGLVLLLLHRRDRLPMGRLQRLLLLLQGLHLAALLGQGFLLGLQGSPPLPSGGDGVGFCHGRRQGRCLVLLLGEGRCHLRSLLGQVGGPLALEGEGLLVVLAAALYCLQLVALGLVSLLLGLPLRQLGFQRRHLLVQGAALIQLGL